MAKRIEVSRLRTFIAARRSRCSIVGNFLVLHNLRPHRHERGYCYVKWSRSISWVSPVIASKFCIAALTAFGHAHPAPFKTGPAADPLLDYSK